MSGQPQINVLPYLDSKSVTLYYSHLEFLRYMYWSDFSGQSQIERAYMDGTHRKVIYKGGRANGLTIDYMEKRLYWTSLDTNTIESADLYGKIQCYV